MADPICRWRNTSVKQAIEYNSLFPLNKSEKKAARSLVENRWRILGSDNFFTTPYQLAAQMGMYYEDDEFFYPKFPKLISVEEANQYMLHWGKRYYAPNPYTKSLSQTNKPVILNNFLVNWCLEHPDSKLDDALAEMFKEPIGNTDILVNMLNSFSEVKVDQGKLTLKDDAPRLKYEQVVLDVDKNDKKFFFEFVSEGWADSTNKSPVVLFKDKVLKNFVFKVFQLLESFDGMNNLKPYAEESNGNEDEAIIIKFKNENITLTGCLIDTTQENVNLRNAVTHTTRWFSEPLSYCNRNVYLSTQWNGAGNYQLTFEDLKYFINLCYGKHYGIEKDGDGFIMYAYSNITPHAIRLPLQQIFYGAPGTGKSHKVKEVTDKLPKSDVFRTTFHPDSDYSTFVGCYKPKMVKAPIRDGSGHEITSACEDEKKRIAYEFVPQAFINAYVRAYHTEEPVFLVIEEINRGNCAQIFGDMFQLLDRNCESGESDYAIKPDSDLQNYLSSVMADARTDKEEIKTGEEMCLPSNLYIWATMNTSDQSLFPIDSAFKRRWDWKYVPINYSNKARKVTLTGDVSVDWVKLQQRLNELIYDATESEDKMLGDWFVTTGNNEISEEVLVGKIIFYLWNDVARVDAGKLFDLEIEKHGKKCKVTFSDFYSNDGTVNSDVVKKWLKQIEVLKEEPAEDKQNTLDSEASPAMDSGASQEQVL